MTKSVHPDLLEVALDRVSGSVFEQFSLDFFASVLGQGFVPLGGVKDGGADAFGGDRVYEGSGRAVSFFQMSVQEDFRSKIRHTITRLKDFGRAPISLTYVTSRTVKHIDVEEDELSQETGVTVRVRDARYIAAHINDSQGARSAFEIHLRPLTSFLKGLGSSSLIPATNHVRSPAVYVFLRQELDRREGDMSLVDAVTDSLVLWALEGTDPDAGIFMDRQQVIDKICAELPPARAIVEPRVGHRLTRLSRKTYPGGRQVRWHQQEDKFCLPFEPRQRMEAENVEDEKLRIDVLADLYSRARDDYGTSLTEPQLRRCAEVTLRALQRTFETEGLEFSHFLSSGENHDFPAIAESIRSAVEEMGTAGSNPVEFGLACLSVARGCFYSSTDSERSYLRKLARTYTLLFTLNTEPRLIQYFQEMTADFVLYVGSDMLVRALSERYLQNADQVTRNTLTVAARSGARLVLTEPVLEEVLWNFRTTDYEFKNYFLHLEPYVTREMAASCPKIMLRAYFYAQLDSPEPPSSWQRFVEQFLDYELLHHARGEGDLRRYLQATFGMEYYSRDELMSLVKEGEVHELTADLESIKDNKLASNDALLVCATYGRRVQKRESSKISEFGFRTWWLTSETRILRYTKDLVKKNGGTPYMMRPDFLLNFLTFAPSAKEARAAFADVFPSLLGVRLSKRMDDDAFHKIMEDVRQAGRLEEGRRMAQIAGMADQLKGDFEKEYRKQFSKS